MNMMIVAGGTGGHVYPALAVANYVRDKGHSIEWIGSNRAIEQRAIAPFYPLHTIAMQGVVGAGIKRWLGLPLRLVRSMRQCAKIYATHNTDIVFTTGGYVAVPAGIVARLKRIPLVIHESNAVAGMSNRLLAVLAKHVLTSYPQVINSPKTRCVGTPVRTEIESFTRDDSKAEVLGVMGGSLGAQILNEIVPRALARIEPDKRPRVIHQTGKGKLNETVIAYERHVVNAEIVEYIDDIDTFYRDCRLLMCRAGALTITELGHVGVPAVLVPYPHATGNHQLANAQRMAQVGAAVCIEQNAHDTEQLVDEFAQTIEALWNDESRLSSMAQAMRATAKKSVAKDIGELLITEGTHA